MTFVIEHPDPQIQSAYNLRVLEEMIHAFEPHGVSGYAVLSRTAFLHHCRWSFHGTGTAADTFLHGPTFHPALLEVPALASRLREVTAEFLTQVQALCEAAGPSAVAGSSGSTIIHVDFTALSSTEKKSS